MENTTIARKLNWNRKFQNCYKFSKIEKFYKITSNYEFFLRKNGIIFNTVSLQNFNLRSILLGLPPSRTALQKAQDNIFGSSPAKISYATGFSKVHPFFQLTNGESNVDKYVKVYGKLQQILLNRMKMCIGWRIKAGICSQIDLWRNRPRVMKHRIPKLELRHSARAGRLSCVEQRSK